MHHIVVYLCSQLDSTHVGTGVECTDFSELTAISLCRTEVVVTAWAVGGQVSFKTWGVYSAKDGIPKLLLHHGSHTSQRHCQVNKSDEILPTKHQVNMSTYSPVGGEYGVNMSTTGGKYGVNIHLMLQSSAADSIIVV